MRHFAISASLIAALSLLSAGCPSPDDPAADVALVDLLKLKSVTENYGGGALFAIWHSAPDDVWLAGGKPGRSEVLQFDGQKWTLHAPGTSHQLWWIHGFGNGDTVFVVGAAGTISRYQDGEWTPQPSGHPTTVLYGVWGAAPNDVWAVGGIWHAAPPGVDSQGDVMIHFDGTDWTDAVPDALPSDRTTKDLFKVWGASRDAVFVVGSQGLALHFDGSTWRREDTQTDQTLFTVSGRSATDVYAVGGTGKTVLVHWDGGAWSPVQVPEFAPPQTAGLWTAPGHPVYIAGLSGYTARLDPDGTWHEGDIVSSKGYHSIQADDGGGVWVVGGDITSLNPATGAIAIAGHTIPRP